MKAGTGGQSKDTSLTLKSFKFIRKKEKGKLKTDRIFGKGSERETDSAMSDQKSCRKNINENFKSNHISYLYYKQRMMELFLKLANNTNFL